MSEENTATGQDHSSRGEVAPQQPYSLRLLSSDRVISLASDRCTIGTARRNTVVLTDPFISRHHCTLIAGEGKLWLNDEGSRNGTWVNDLRVERCEVSPGARILLGRTRLQLVDGTRERRDRHLIGEHLGMKRVLDLIERLAPALRPVLILGETGTGKELVARAIHRASSCRAGPFEPLNCSAIPRELAEAELFGHAQGAFTGAGRERRGAFERAAGGTLFLDEIGEMPLDLQPKILRVLEEGVVQRIGEEQHRPVAVRVIAATHRHLPRAVEQGHFRLDLYHRLAVGVIRIPPLRERQEDIPLLAGHFLQQIGLARPVLSEQVLEFLQARPWPGNVRELRNALHRAVIESGPLLTVDDFAFLIDEVVDDRHGAAGLIQCLGRSFAEIRREIYLLNLGAHGGNRSAAASALRIPKSTFFDHLREMGV